MKSKRNWKPGHLVEMGTGRFGIVKAVETSPSGIQTLTIKIPLEKGMQRVVADAVDPAGWNEAREIAKSIEAKHYRKSHGSPLFGGYFDGPRVMWQELHAPLIPLEAEGVIEMFTNGKVTMVFKYVMVRD